MKPMNVLLALSVMTIAGITLAWRHFPSVIAVAVVAPPVAYPEGYRGWGHVKSTAIGPTHRSFATMGGFQHIYANREAMAGYRTRAFPEGSIVVFEWLEMRQNDGAFAEGPRRQVDVMVKDGQRFATTGGWGFQRFVKDSKTELAQSPTPQQCFTCHDTQKKDGLVLSSYRQ
jgi:hypothetical protein